MTAETEILTQIFREIHGYRGCYRRQENFSDLYSCLLVSKSWCKAAIPVLWSSVFYSIQTSRPGVITTYLSCLRPEGLKVIADSGIKLPPSLSSITIPSNNDQDGGGVQVKTPMYDYPSYLEEMDFDKLLKTIFEWCQKYRNTTHRRPLSLCSSISSSMSSSMFSSFCSPQSHSVSTLASSVSSSFIDSPLSYSSLNSSKPEHITRVECVLRALLQLFASRNANIQCFVMNSVPNYLLYEDYFENLKMIDFSGLFGEQEIRGVLEKVNECRLEWDAMAVDGFLDAFGTSCRSLETLNVNFAHDPKFANLFINKKQATDLAILITSQKSLKSFILQDHQYFTHYFLQSLNTQVRTLKKLEFYSVDFKSCCSFEVIAKCDQLELLVFEDCINITAEMVTPLLYAKLPKLKYVHITKPLDEQESRITSEYSSRASSRSSSRSSSFSRSSSDLLSSRHQDYQNLMADPYLSLMSIPHHLPSPSSLNHRLQQQLSDDFNAICPELIRWAHRRNNPRRWWSLNWWRKQLTLQTLLEFDYFDFFSDCVKMIGYTLLFLISLYILVPFFVGITNMIGRWILISVGSRLGVDVTCGMGPGSCGLKYLWREGGCGNMNFI